MNLKKTLFSFSLLAAVVVAPLSASAQTVPVASAALDSMNDLSDQDSTALQMLMSTYSTLLQGMSNLQKTAQDAAQAIVANWKQ